MIPRAAVLLVGDELVEGRRADQNGPWLAQRLDALGLTVHALRVVGDLEDAIAVAVREEAARAEVIVVSGGLGPTSDDVTREGLAAAAGVALEEDPGALAAVVRAARARGQDPDDPWRRRQARVPRGGGWLENPAGSAPGLRAVVGSTEVFALPGVPAELRAMFDAAVLPALVALPGREPAVAGTLHAAGLPEPDVARLLEGVDEATGTRLGLYPGAGVVAIRYGARGPGAEGRVEAAVAEARRRLGEAAWGDRPLEAEVVARLRAAGLVVTTAESMTGGLVARRLTDVPGASDVFRGGWVTYADAVKAAELGVPADLLATRGAVSPEVARAMARGARDRAGADAAVAVTGVAGPADGAAPDGTPIPAGSFHVGVALGARVEVTSHCVPGGRDVVRRRAAMVALDRLRRLLGAEPGAGATPG